MKEKIIKLENGEELTMKVPTVRVLKNAKNRSDKDMEQTIYMIATLTNKQESEIEELDIKDFKALQDGIKDFLVEAGFLESDK
ncbi:phage tail assembly protein [Campylobacter jejuni]|uniref:phage tail assembly protein n=1 Tax=unclassified Campylobacter TaxID=2593542 RepID=UPI000873D372|nr:MULTISPECIES: phage tail assembly protein [unclassified Campylobacter]EAH9333998.1 phage tail assembly protein [Campylobacter jejuni]EAH9335686.1 phage tail assembly protein [Campylobacter jejuni]EAJ4373669.1 phage tail assembly protein [Campylobacter jejuni]EAJ5638804.1 phage tail assembly protein [Campylobacter jejuni]EAK1698950.1 phage tail assembly protein [Campylobacter jejuni]